MDDVPSSEDAVRHTPTPHVLTSRFNTETWSENEAYRNKHGTDGCIYGCPLRISHKVGSNTLAYVLEMNNSTNLIEGVGVIRNYPNFDQPDWIYGDNNYNRYIYTGRRRMNRDELVRYDTDLVQHIETVCFTGKTHLKRGAGLTLVPNKFLRMTHGANHEPRNPHTVRALGNELRAVFKMHFTHTTNPTNPTNPTDTNNADDHS